MPSVHVGHLMTSWHAMLLTYHVNVSPDTASLLLMYCNFDYLWPSRLLLLEAEGGGGASGCKATSCSHAASDASLLSVHASITASTTCVNPETPLGL